MLASKKKPFIGVIEAREKNLSASTLTPVFIDPNEKPNYHLMRLQSIEKLQKALKKAGLYIIKAKGIKQCLEAQRSL